jgi:uncharacterized membrane protein YhaH (DUF805 family)
MGFAESIRTCLRKYADFSGRATRPEYWWFFLAAGVVLVVVNIVYRNVGTSALAAVQFAVYIACLIPGLAAGARRLHDTNHTGWWQVIDLVPIIGFLVLVYLLVQSGTDGPNKYGEDPVV